MRLREVVIEGYRSVRGAIRFHFDPIVTIILGANDHGKSNLLAAITHLNVDNPFEAETDLNWDYIGKEREYPAVEYHLDLDDDDRQYILSLYQNHCDNARESENPEEAEEEEEEAEAEAEAEKVAEAAAEEAEEVANRPSLDDVPTTLQLDRRGDGAALSVVGADLPPPVLDTFVQDSLPRVEIIRPQESIPDSVTVESLQDEAHEFMRGIFFYAGLSEDEWSRIFDQNDVTIMRLQKASKRLNKRLREDWSQGKNLTFILQHESKSGEIILRIEDPAVAGQLVRVSRRSSGFSHFFSLKTVLFAREREHEAESYIFLFDEPGVFLHPAGQQDLLKVLDGIGKNNQVAYVTHSIFMLNKTFPSRHRLIKKTSKGTELDGKPHVERWGPAIEALGLSLAGTILFAQHVLLVEGDSDPMYIPAVLQKLVAMGAGNIDLNGLAAIPTGNSRNAEALIGLLTDGASRAPDIAMLFDGDAGGKAHKKRLKPVLDRLHIPAILLENDTSIEDHLPSVDDLYVRAVAQYVCGLLEMYEKPFDADAVLSQFKASFATEFHGEKTFNVADWAATQAKTIAGIEDPSKVGIARAYVGLLEAADPKDFDKMSISRALRLLKQVKKNVKAPEISEPLFDEVLANLSSGGGN